ncbi:hypothetical protein [Circular genetic element sp.]|nr:hypothetical protein [Circular genetic element sp.]
MGAAVGTLFAIAGTLLAEAILYVPVIASVAADLFLEFGATTALTAFGGGVGLTEGVIDTALYLYSGYQAITALQTGLLATAAFVGAGQFTTAGLLGAGIALSILGGGIAIGFSIGSGNTQLLPKPDLQKFLYSDTATAKSNVRNTFKLFSDSLFDTNTLSTNDDSYLFNSPGSGQLLRVQGGTKRKQTMYNYGSQGILAGGRRPAKIVKRGPPKGR